MLTSISPRSGVHRNTSVLTPMFPSCVKDCGRPLKRLRHSPHQWQWDRSSTMIEELTPFHWSQVTWFWLRLTPTGEEVKDWWEKEPYEVEHQVVEGIPSYLMKNQWIGCSWVLHWNQLFLIAPTEGTHLCTVVQAKQAWCTTTLEEQTQKSETEGVPQSVNCLSPAQCQTGETPLGWMNRGLHTFILMLPKASWIDKGWKVWCRVV